MTQAVISDSNSQMVIKKTLNELQNGSSNVESCYAILLNEFETLLRFKLEGLIKKTEKQINKAKKEEGKLEKKAEALKAKEKILDEQLRKVKELNAFSRIDVARESLENVKNIYPAIDRNYFEILIESGDLPDYRIDDILKRKSEQMMSQQYYLDLTTFCKKFRKIVYRLSMVLEEKVIEDLKLPYSMLMTSKSSNKDLSEKISKTVGDSSSSLNDKTKKIIQIVEEERENCLGVFNHATINELYWKLDNNIDVQKKATQKIVDRLLLYCPIFVCVDKALELMKNNPDVTEKKWYYAFYCKYIKPDMNDAGQQYEAFQNMSGFPCVQSSFYKYAEKGKEEFIQILFFYLDIIKNYEDKEDIQMLFRELVASV